eukprot:SAG11_NODE_7048_length_1203_cov_1.078804_1_plen_78_part_00
MRHLLFALHATLALAQDWQVINGGGQWDADVARNSYEECGVGDLDALTSIPCECSCAPSPAPAGAPPYTRARNAVPP